jgi:pyridoxamine 5'-phosphate oxidase
MTTGWQTLLTQAIERNSSDRSALFVQFATVTSDGKPAVRTVRYRFMLSDDRAVFTTDTRSEKVAQLQQAPNAEACWYFRESEEQFRLSGTAHVIAHSQDVELNAARLRSWRERSQSSRQTFMWPAPSSERQSTDVFDLPAPDEPPDNFALLILKVERVDYLRLGRTSHERILFHASGSKWQSTQVNA